VGRGPEDVGAAVVRIVRFSAALLARCLRKQKVVGVERIELPSSVCRTEALPLDDTPSQSAWPDLPRRPSVPQTDALLAAPHAGGTGWTRTIAVGRMRPAGASRARCRCGP